MTTIELVARSSSVNRDATNNDLVKLVERARTGDRVARHEIVLRFDDSLRRIARAHGLDGQTCNDVVQQSWLSAFSQIETLRSPEALGGWLHTIVRRESRRTIARRRRETVQLIDIESHVDSGESDPKIHSDLPAPEAEALRSAQRDLLRVAWGQLSRRDQELLTLLMDEPRRPYAEIARHTGLPIGSIGPTRQRCLARLRVQLEKLGVNHRWTSAA